MIANGKNVSVLMIFNFCLLTQVKNKGKKAYNDLKSKMDQGKVLIILPLLVSCLICSVFF